jgi:hypothetical protein
MAARLQPERPVCVSGRQCAPVGGCGLPSASNPFSAAHAVAYRARQEPRNTSKAGRGTMGRKGGERTGGLGRLLFIAAMTVTGAVIVAVAVSTGGLRLGKSGHSAPSPEQLAQDRCQSDVLKRLVAPATTHFSGVRTETSTLEADGKDLFPLTLDEPLKGIDTSRITVLNVSGVVNAPTEIGSTLQDHFDCRAYFVDGKLAHTLVLFDHDH